MQSDVWCLLTCIDDDDSSCTMGAAESKYLEYDPGSEFNLFLLNKETMNKWKQKNQMRTQVEQKINRKAEQQTK